MIQMKNVLFAADFSDSSQNALRYATSFAREYGAKLWAVHVVDEAANAVCYDMMAGQLLDDLRTDLEQKAREKMERLVPPDKAAGLTWEGVVRKGAPAKEIVDMAEEVEADIIVCGTHGRTGLKHLLFGSVAETVVRLAPCPVLTVRHPAHAAARGETAG